MYEIKDRIFSPAYREMVKGLKKMAREDASEERKLDDIRSSEGAGRKGPASRPTSISQSGHRRRNRREEPGPINWEEEANRNSGTTPATS